MSRGPIVKTALLAFSLALALPTAQAMAAGASGDSLFSKPKKTPPAAKAPVKKKNTVTKKKATPLTPMQRAEADIRAGRFQKAIDRLNGIVEKEPKNADAWNLIGFASRKLEKFDASFKAYEAALGLEANHKGALEYLGEWYLDNDNPEGALEQYKALSAACDGCKEQRQLETAIVEYTAEKLDDGQRKSLQERLAAAGHYKGPIDGDFGPGSRAALRAFQQEKGIDEIGLMPGTLAALNGAS